MLRRAAVLAAVIGLFAGPAAAQKSGGTLKFFHRDSPASMSILEEATISTVAPMMSVFNNLILFNQHEKQNRPEFIQPELAESWSWNPDFTRLSGRRGCPISTRSTGRSCPTARRRPSLLSPASST